MIIFLWYKSKFCFIFYLLESISFVLCKSYLYFENLIFNSLLQCDLFFKCSILKNSVNIIMNALFKDLHSTNIS
jgi:hypothetical protein